MSSFAPARFTKSLPANVDLSDKQYYRIKDNGSGRAVLCGNNELGLGQLMNAPEAGEACITASVGGGAKAVYSGGAMTTGLELRCNASGELVAATAANDIVVAIAREANAATSGIIEIEPVYYQKSA